MKIFKQETTLSDRVGEIVVKGFVVGLVFLKRCNDMRKSLFSLGWLRISKEAVLSGTPEEDESLWIAFEEARSPEDFQRIWEDASSGSYVESEAWRRLWEISETCNQWRWLWKRTIPGTPEHQKAWDCVKERVGELLARQTDY